MRKALVSIALAACLAAPAAAQDAEGPGSVFEVPDPHGGNHEVEGHMDVITDMDLFVRRGFVPADWKTHEAFVAQVAVEVVVPDYVERTGRSPESVSIDVASLPFRRKARGLDDMVTMSRLPGDCTEDGCLVQFWSLEGEEWTKVLQFHATGVAWKAGDKAGTAWLAAVGDSVAPSRVYFWDGERFVGP